MTCLKCNREDYWTGPDESPCSCQSHKRKELVTKISAELDRAYAKHGRKQWSKHEFYGVLLEEVDELWNDIKSDTPQSQVLEELVQVAAMCFRYYETGGDKNSHPLQLE